MILLVGVWRAAEAGSVPPAAAVVGVAASGGGTARKVIDVPRNRYRQCLHRQSRSGLAGGSARSPSSDGSFPPRGFDERSTVTNPRSSNRATACYAVVTAQPTRVATAAMLEASGRGQDLVSPMGPHVPQLRTQDSLLMPCQSGPGRTVGRVPLRVLAMPSRLGARRTRKRGVLPLAAYEEDWFTPVLAVRLGNRLSTPTPQPS
jgi:hypothetical protein